MAKLIRLLPKIRRALSRTLRERVTSKDFALAAVIDLVSCTALRAGSEAYARAHGTRGAATLLKSNVWVKGDTIVLRLRGKEGQKIEKKFRSGQLARALKSMQRLTTAFMFIDERSLASKE